MKLTKTIFLIAALSLSVCGFAQDTTKKVVTKEPCSVKNEVSINATYLLKQIIGLSYSTFQMLPYDLTYKLIFKHYAIRVGAGVTLNNSQTNSTTTTTGQYSTIAGPDQIVPSYNNSANFYYRAGYEYRSALWKKFVVYAGLDFIGQYGKTSFQNCSLYNNLPDYYSFSKNTGNTTITTFGGGPVAGIQFYFTKSLSLFTEVPLYFNYTHNNQYSDQYYNHWMFDNNIGDYAFVSSETKSTNKSTMKTLQLTLPVTLYLALKF